MPPHSLVMKVMTLAIEDRLSKVVCTEQLVAALKNDPATAWAQCILLDAHRAKRMWSTSYSFAASLRFTNFLTQLFGPPPSPIALLEASGMSRYKFLEIVEFGKLSKLALNPTGLAEEDYELFNDLSRYVLDQCPRLALAQTQAIGQLLRSLHVTARRVTGERHVDNVYTACAWDLAVNQDVMPLRLMQHFLRVCEVTPGALGLSLLLALTASPTSWIERPWSQFGIHNCSTDVIALWANVTRRQPPKLEDWAMQACLDEPGFCLTNPQVMPKVAYLKEYDPATNNYFVRCNTVLEEPFAPSTAWITASKLPDSLKSRFATRRMNIRARDTGHALADLLLCAGEVGTSFIREVATVLHQHLQKLVPGDLGIKCPRTLKCAAQWLQRPGIFVPWETLRELPRILLPVARNAPDPTTADRGAPLVLWIIKQAIKSTEAAEKLFQLAEAVNKDQERQFVMQFAEPRFPSDALFHAAMRIVSGTDPEHNRFSTLMAALTAFVMPSFKLKPVLVQMCPGDNASDRVECAVSILEARLPTELVHIVLRFWLLAVSKNAG